MLINKLLLLSNEKYINLYLIVALKSRVHAFDINDFLCQHFPLNYFDCI